jgi:hypothetical protein
MLPVDGGARGCCAPSLKPRTVQRNASDTRFSGQRNDLNRTSLLQALWTLSAAITLPVYLSLLAGSDGRGSRANGIQSALLGFLGLRKPLIPLTHVDAASGAAAVSGLWGELFMLKALLVFEGVSASASRRSAGRTS